MLASSVSTKTDGPQRPDYPSFMAIVFDVLHRQNAGPARVGRLQVGTVTVQTPAFMPVGTAATVKALPGEDLVDLGASLILANTYHLYLRPGGDVVQGLGGLHDFMSWPGAILTDSGGFQVFSHRELRQISEEGVRFRSHLDGSSHFLTPEASIQLQEKLGSNIIMAFDECTPYPVTHFEARESMLRSMRWAERCRSTHPRDDGQALFGIVQGGVFPDLRRQSLEMLSKHEMAGTALGGFSVGEPKQMMYDLVEEIAPGLPEDRPRYLMGVGTPLDLVLCAGRGIDLFDCVLPTRNARNGTLFTWQGRVKIKNARHRRDESALDENCSCKVCRTYSRAYLRHLFVSGEILASLLNTYHNVAFYMALMARIRTAIANDSLGTLLSSLRESYAGTD